MKKFIPAFFAACLVLAMVSRDQQVRAQEARGLKRSVIINNGDTTVNGKKFSEIDKSEREKLRQEFKEMSRTFRAERAPAGDRVIIRRRGSLDSGVIAGTDRKAPNVLFWNSDPDDDMKFEFRKDFPGEFRTFRFDGDSLNFSFNTDSMMKNFNFRFDGLDSNLRKRIITMHRDLGAPGAVRIERGAPGAFHFDRMPAPGFAPRNNSSSFSYSHVDKDGIASRMNIRISDANKEQLKKITGSETISKTADVTDLTLFPNFSSGKMTLSFGLAGKGAAKVSVLDSELKPVYNDDASVSNGIYTKQISLPRNGVYYITVNQSGNWFVKRVVKE